MSDSNSENRDKAVEAVEAGSEARPCQARVTVGVRVRKEEWVRNRVGLRLRLR